jgi:hypothetical protein
MRVFTRVAGKLAVWEAPDMEYAEAIKCVRDELGAKHKATILVLVKY